MTPRQLNRVASDDALTAIYRMANDEQTRVIAARLGERLGVSAPVISSMYRELSFLDRRNRGIPSANPSTSAPA